MTSLDDLLDNLTPAQRQAVEHRDGPLLILAGPGSGKTRVVTHRIAWLLRQGVRASQVLALTFTNKAAEEMRGRVAERAPGEAVWTSTFHRFCARLLRQYAGLAGLEPNFAIYDTADSAQALRQALESAGLGDLHFTPGQIASAISWAKNNLLTAAQYVPRVGHPVGAVVAEVYPRYQARLLRANAVDYDDLLLHVAMILRENSEVRAQLDARYRYVLVDEYQDTNLAQYTIVRALSIDYPNLAVTGDPDQSIYGWRGANLSNILDFEKDYPRVRVVRLEQNYRSTGRILHAADLLIGHNVRRKAKSLFTENPPGAPVRLAWYATQTTEAEGISARIATEVRAGRRRPRDFAIFYRTNALSRALEIALREAGLPYQMVHGVEFFQRKEIKDVLSYLALLNNPRDDQALLRVINTPVRGISKNTVERLAEHADRRKINLLEAARESGLVEGLPARAPVAVARFVAMFDRLSLLASRPVAEVMQAVLEESGYRAALAQSSAEEDQQRLANVEELVTAARQFDERHPIAGGLEAFLEESCLVNDTDDWEAGGDAVTLMTLHAAKGLEFPVVFIIAVESRVLPHERTQDNPQELEEERRLLFVGMTRAKEELQLSLARRRDYRGQQLMAVPSPFLMELPVAEMEQSSEASTAGPAPSASRSRDAAVGLTEGDLPVWTDEEPPRTGPLDAVHDGGNAPAAPTQPQRRFTPAPLRLTTAAELAGGAAARPSPEAFEEGMVVRHPEYGLGTVLSISGDSSRRRATVSFPSVGEQRTFVLASSPLVPVKAV
jgi:DNA helicase-2/ATP-dependent DNA helicase PcrA